MKPTILSFLSLALIGLANSIPAANADQELSKKPQLKALEEYKTSGELVADLPESHWRTLSSENTIVMSLPQGEILIELSESFAPKHVENIATLVSEKYFDGTAVIRSQDNYVAQWGDTTDIDEGNPDAKPKPIGSAEAKLNVEFFASKEQVSFTPIESRDAYADVVGFVEGMPVAGDADKLWLSHCYGMVGVSRGMERDSGNGSGLYAITGHAPRHLDLNVTLVGKVWQGMEHLTTLPRGKGESGFYLSPDNHVPIEKVRFLDDQRVVQVMRTDTAAFERFVELRTSRNEDWFLEPTGKIELCNVWVPVRKK